MIRPLLSSSRSFVVLGALLLAAAVPACASRQMADSVASEQHVETSDDVQRDPIVEKLYEASATDNGQTGVDNWVLYEGLTSDGNGAFMAYGTNLDGLLVAIVHVDMASGRVSVFEKANRDGTAETKIEDGPFLAYVNEMHALLLGLGAQANAANGAGARPQDLSRRPVDCMFVAASAAVALAGALYVGGSIATEAVPVAIGTVAIAIAVALGVPAAHELLANGQATASAVITEWATYGATVLDASKKCWNGSPSNEPTR